MARVDVRHVINSRELTIDTSCLVEQIVVFIYCNRSPVRNINVSSSLGKERQRIWEVEE